jgi:signal transduction histidine kinase/CheY-like chemotaxis protein
VKKIILIITLAFCSLSAADYEIIKGRLDLQNWDLASPGEISLDGQWLFAEGLYDSIQQLSGQQLSTINVPLGWNRQANKKRAAMGTGTYFLQVLAPSSAKILEMKIGAIATAYEFYINGGLIHQSGVIGNSPETMTPVWKPEIIRFAVKDDTLNFVIKASNFNFRDGGIVESLSISGPNKIIFDYRRALLRTFLILGALMIMSLYHFALYAIRRSESSILWFALLSLSVSVRLLFSGDHHIYMLFESIHYRVLNVMEYLSFFFSVLFALHYLKALFTKSFSSLILKILDTLILFLIAMTLILPVWISSTLILPFNIVILLTGSYALYVLLYLSVKNNKQAQVILASFLLLFLFVLNDIFHNMGIIKSGYFAPYGMFLFMFGQAVLLSDGFMRAFKTIELQHQELTDYRDHLEDLVRERTVELEQARKTAEEMAEKAIKASKAKDEFLATMSHEIRTPIHGIIGATTLLKNDKMNEEQTDYLQTIEYNSQALLSLFNDILDFAKIESEKLELENLPIHLNGLLENVIDVVKLKVREKDLQLFYFIDDAVPEMILGDETRFRQVLLNLINNAIKFTESGYVMLRLQPDPKAPESHLRFEVEDSGIGIPKEKQDRLFQVFSQVDSTTTRRYGGTGLGLAISKRLIELMNGKIDVTSEENKGSTFYFTIPYQSVTLKTITEKEDSLSEHLAGKEILIATPFRQEQAILENFFRKQKMQIKRADDKQSLAEGLVSENKSDFILIEQNFIDKDIKTFYEWIRKDSSALLIFLTYDESLAGQIREMPDSVIVSKPLRLSWLKSGLASLTEKINTIKRTQAETDKKQLESDFAEKHPAKILLAEDNIVNQKIAARLLEKLGYQVKIAENGKIAVDMLSDENFDLIFMDINMPEMDGIEATKAIRSQFGTEKPRIVAMTANAMAGDRERYLSIGMDDYISKPVKIPELKAILSFFSV